MKHDDIVRFEEWRTPKEVPDSGSIVIAICADCVNVNAKTYVPQILYYFSTEEHMKSANVPEKGYYFEDWKDDGSVGYFKFSESSLIHWDYFPSYGVCEAHV